MSVPPGLEPLLVFRVEGKPGSEAKATLDAPDQGVKGIPVDKLSLEGEDVTMGIQPVGLEFKGKRDKAGETIVGRAKLGAAIFPLTLKKVASASEPSAGPEPGTLSIPRDPFAHPSTEYSTWLG